MTSDERLERLEHRVRELQTAVATIVRHLGIQQEVAAAERSRLDELRLVGEPEAPVQRLIVLYSERPGE